MFKYIYIVNALISAFCLIYFFETTLNKVNQKQLILLCFTNIANYSYAMSAFAANLEGVYVAYQLYYMGCVFSTIFLFYVIMEICGYKTNRFVRIFFLIYGITILALLATAKTSNLYYVSMDYTQFFGVSTLKKVYGPLHNLLIIMIGVIDVLSIFIVIYAYKKKKEMPFSITLHLLLILFIGSFFYMLPKVLHMPFDFLPFLFTAFDIFLVVLFKRASMYDITANLLNVFEQGSEYGYIAFDLNYRLLGSNNFAKEIFPCLKNIHIDQKLTDKNTLLYKEIISWVDGLKPEDETVKYIKNEDKDLTVMCCLRNIVGSLGVNGHLIEIQDITPQQKYVDLLNNYNTQLEQEVTLKTNKIEEIQDSIITGIAMLVESRDNSTGGHIKRTSEGVKIFIEELKKSDNYKNLSNHFCNSVIKAAPMHDLGKIAVQDAILRKPGIFEPFEYDQMKKHSEMGAEIVKGVLEKSDDDEFKNIAINIAHYHHEKWNGTGYPSGLNGNEIPLEARIMAFADVFDALVSERCYKKAFTYEKAFEIIQNDLGSHFDPELGPIFMKCRPALEELYNKEKSN